MPSSETRRGEMVFDSLPNEIISAIFVHIYRISRKEVRPRTYLNRPHEDEDSNRDMTWKDENLLDPCLFPKAIASVCHRWRAIAETIPFIWTRIVAFVDSSPTPLSQVQAYLALSRDLPLHVHVLRRSYINLEWKEERQICRDFINILVPHVRRCQNIEIDVFYSSSLPSISKDFFGCAPLLEALNLKCKTDTEVASGGSNPRPEIAEEPFITPALKDLCVDGRNFVHACLALPSWIESVPKGKLRLSLHNFAPSDMIYQDFEFTLHDFVLVLDRLKVTRLSLSNVQFHNHSTPAPNIFLSADTLELDSLCYESFIDIMAFIDDEGVESIHISRCHIEALGFEIYSDFLTLEEIGVDSEISGFLSDWSGAELRISDCPSFDDSALMALGNMEDALIRSLDIKNCPNISPEGVKKMVQDLNECVVGQYHDGGFADREKIALHYLSIRGHPHVLTPEEEHWFRENASSGIFVWTARK